MSARLYVSKPPEVGQLTELPQAQTAHVRALRLRIGDEVVLFDGSGVEWIATLHALGNRAASVLVSTQRAGLELPARRVTLAMSIISADRMDWIVQKATELGASEIIPLRADRSQGASLAARKRTHWQAVALAACEQCGRSRIPVISEALDVNALLAARTGQAVWVADKDGTSPSDSVADAPESTARTLCVGPEGGWSPLERASFQAHGVVFFSLSRATLRAETAALTALALYGRD